ncbi:hypothetical protein AB0399_36245 [Streptomyces sp. NPDC088194]|uniref:hypothetical protein n=1 Tax=Streptomyces sp. NPDC088194 TaxID=3154931 RepID=UPI00344CF808
MKRPIRLTGHRTSRVAALGLAAACGLFVVPASHAEGTPPASFVRTSAARAASASCQVTLPGGLKATVTPDGARLTDPAAATGQTVLSFRSGGHQYLMPASATARSATKGLAGYDTTALAQRACGADAFAPPTAQPSSARHGSYTMGRLTAHLIDTDGKPTNGGTLLLVSADRTADTNTFFAAYRGTLKVSVPTGRYEAVYVQDRHVTIAPEVTIGDGTSITLDARTSTHEIKAPSTPRPTTLADSEFALYRGDGTPDGDADSLVLQFLSLGSDPLGVTVNTTAPVKHGRFAAVATADLEGPADAPRPYVYHVADSYDHLPSSYPTTIDPKSLSTVTQTFSAPTGPTGTDLLVQNVTPVWAATAGVRSATGFDYVTPGTTLTDYVSTSAGLDWRTQVQDEQTSLLLTGKDTVPRAGSHTSVTWEADAPRPGVQVDTGSSAVYCGACANADTMVFGIGEDGDSTPGTMGVGFDDSGTITLTRNGTVQATGTGSLFGTAVDVPAGRATYRLRQQTTRVHGDLSPSTDTTWTFTADPGKGRALPSRVPCTGLTGPCAALPLLFASTSTDADLQHRLTTGRHSVALDVTREQYSSSAPVTGATLQVSYDGGTTWQGLHVTGAHGAYRAAYTVPASASGGTVSFKLSAWDGQGNRIDQVLPRAYQVR